MKHSVIALALTSAVLAFAQNAFAADTDPLDFDYTLDGDMSTRPALVFNDGHNTYFQARAGQVIISDGAQPQGPYLVVAGTPGDIAFSVDGHSASAHWNRLNEFAGGATPMGALRDDQPAGFVGFSNHLILIGSHGDIESLRALTVTMPVGELVKTLVPQGWSGSAQKYIDLTGMRTFSTAAGENWLHALDHLVSQLGLYATVNFDEKHVRLSAQAPKSDAVNYASGISVANGAAADPIAAIASASSNLSIQANKADQLRSGVQSSLLASVFGAEAIRDGDATHTQIRFGSAQDPKLTVETLDGVSLHPKWDAQAHVLTIDRAPQFVVANASQRVEVARVEGAVYDFPTTNPAHLEAVFDQDGATFFKFADTVVAAKAMNADHSGTGEQKGRYYRFNGIATTFIATGDGQAVTVTRRHDVRYFDRYPVTPASQVSK